MEGDVRCSVVTFTGSVGGGDTIFRCKRHLHFTPLFTILYPEGEMQTPFPFLFSFPSHLKVKEGGYLGDGKP